METQSVDQDQTAAPLPQEMLEKLFCAIGEIGEQEEERKKPCFVSARFGNRSAP